MWSWWHPLLDGADASSEERPAAAACRPQAASLGLSTRRGLGPAQQQAEARTTVECGADHGGFGRTRFRGGSSREQRARAALRASYKAESEASDYYSGASPASRPGATCLFPRLVSTVHPDSQPQPFCSQRRSPWPRLLLLLPRPLLIEHDLHDPKLLVVQVLACLDRVGQAPLADGRGGWQMDSGRQRTMVRGGGFGMPQTGDDVERRS